METRSISSVGAKPAPDESTQNKRTNSNSPDGETAGNVLHLCMAGMYSSALFACTATLSGSTFLSYPYLFHSALPGKCSHHVLAFSRVYAPRSLKSLQALAPVQNPDETPASAKQHLTAAVLVSVTHLLPSAVSLEESEEWLISCTAFVYRTKTTFCCN